MKNKQEMYEALIAGNTLTTEKGEKLFVDIQHEEGPIVFRYPNGDESRALNALEHPQNFTIEGTPKPRPGDRVHVWDDPNDEKQERILLYVMKGAEYPYHVVTEDTEDRFEEDYYMGYKVARYKHMAPIPKTHTITLDGKSIELSHESFIALKSSLLEADQ